MTAAFLVLGVLAFVSEDDRQARRLVAGIPNRTEDVLSYFVSLAERRGAAKAFEVLRATQHALPELTDVHEIGHALGGILYAEEGVRGFSRCTHDFFNACAHAITIRHLVTYGTSTLTAFRETCTQSSRGTDHYRLCLHGVGHGVFAAAGYDIARALADCATFGAGGQTPAPSVEEVECVGGVVMEIAEGGEHAPLSWQHARAPYVGAEGSFSLCESIVSRSARLPCYFYFTGLLFASSSEDVSSPSTLTSPNIRTALDVCAQLSFGSEERRSCVSGVARHIVPDTLGQQWFRRARMEVVSRMYLGCAAAASFEDISSCIFAVARRISWGSAARAVRTASQFCNDVPVLYREACERGIIGSLVGGGVAQGEARRGCALLLARYRAPCLAAVGELSSAASAAAREQRSKRR